MELITPSPPTHPKDRSLYQDCQQLFQICAYVCENVPPILKIFYIAPHPLYWGESRVLPTSTPPKFGQVGVIPTLKHCLSSLCH